jgi:hypothetical protein
MPKIAMDMYDGGPRSISADNTRFADDEMDDHTHGDANVR